MSYVLLCASVATSVNSPCNVRVHIDCGEAMAMTGDGHTCAVDMGYGTSFEESKCAPEFPHCVKLGEGKCGSGTGSMTACCSLDCPGRLAETESESGAGICAMSCPLNVVFVRV